MFLSLRIKRFIETISLVFLILCPISTFSIFSISIENSDDLYFSNELKLGNTYYWDINRARIISIDGTEAKIAAEFDLEYLLEDFALRITILQDLNNLTYSDIENSWNNYFDSDFVNNKNSSIVYHDMFKIWSINLRYFIFPSIMVQNNMKFNYFDYWSQYFYTQYRNSTLDDRLFQFKTTYEIKNGYYFEYVEFNVSRGDELRAKYQILSKYNINSGLLMKYEESSESYYEPTSYELREYQFTFRDNKKSLLLDEKIFMIAFFILIILISILILIRKRIKLNKGFI